MTLRLDTYHLDPGIVSEKPNKEKEKRKQSGLDATFAGVDDDCRPRRTAHAPGRILHRRTVVANQSFIQRACDRISELP